MWHINQEEKDRQGVYLQLTGNYPLFMFSACTSIRHYCWQEHPAGEIPQNSYKNGLQNFSMLNSWICCFKQGHRAWYLKNLIREGSAVHHKQRMDLWFSKLPVLLEGLGPWGKCVKEQLAVLLYLNISGSDKQVSIVTGISMKQLCSKNVKSCL